MTFKEDIQTVLLIIFLLVGAATFIIGMNMMSGGLKRIAGKGVKKIFKKTGDSRFACLGMGAGVTAIIQSSAATSIMAIGFVNVGVMTIFQGVSIMMGSYIGTTVTGLLASLSNFPFSTYLCLLAVIGVILTFLKNEKVKAGGEVLSGLGLLFFGLKVMSAVFSQPVINNVCQDVFTTIEFPLLLVLLGILFTALVQSSSATTGLVIALVGSGAINFGSSLYVIIGATIGTFISTLLATIGSTTSAKRAGLTAFFIKIIAGFIGLIVVWPFENAVSDLLLNTFKDPGLAAAMFNVIFVVVGMLIILPLINPLIKLSTKIVKDKDAERNMKALLYIPNVQLRNDPMIAMIQAKKEIMNMADLAYQNLKLGYEEIVYQTNKYGKEIQEREENIDFINNAITDFLIDLSHKVDMENERIIGSYFHVINDIERIGDHASNFYDLSVKMRDNELQFSDRAKGELKEMYDIVIEMYDIAFEIFKTQQEETLIKLHELEDRTDDLKRSLSDAHYERITNNQCTIELSPFYSSLVSELERVADHLVNIGYSIVNPTGDEAK